MKSLKQLKSVAVHGGYYHSDDVTAIAAIRLVNPDIKVYRTRDPEILAKAEMRIDVGMKFDPDTMDFDHHQEGVPRNNMFRWCGEDIIGPKKSGVGLLWSCYGSEICANVIADELSLSADDITPDVAERVADMVKEQVIIPIDIEDNGETGAYFSKPSSPYRPMSIGGFIKASVPGNMEVEKGASMDAAFFNIATTVERFLKGTILQQYIMLKDADYVIRTAMAQQGSHLLVLRSPCSWLFGLRQMVKSKSPEQKATQAGFKLVVYPHTNTQCTGYDWYIQSLKKFNTTTSTMELVCPHPQEWRGLTAEMLTDMTEVETALFCHASGYMAIATDFDDALELAKQSLAYNGYSD